MRFHTSYLINAHVSDSLLTEDHEFDYPDEYIEPDNDLVEDEDPSLIDAHSISILTDIVDEPTIQEDTTPTTPVQADDEKRRAMIFSFDAFVNENAANSHALSPERYNKLKEMVLVLEREGYASFNLKYPRKQSSLVSVEVAKQNHADRQLIDKHFLHTFTTNMSADNFEVLSSLSSVGRQELYIQAG